MPDNRQVRAVCKDRDGVAKWWNWWPHSDLHLILDQIRREIPSDRMEPGWKLTIEFED